MSFTKTNRQNRGYGRRDKFGNESKNVFCYENESKNGTIGYKGYFEVNGRLYAVYFNFKPTARTDGKNGNWVVITEYRKQY